MLDGLELVVLVLRVAVVQQLAGLGEREALVRGIDEASLLLV